MTRISKSGNKRENDIQPKRTKMKSSLAARKLIRAYIKSYKSQHKAAAALGITQAQLNGVLHGRLKDTPAIIIALDCAERRAERARYRVKPEPHVTTIDAVATLKAVNRVLDEAQTMIGVILAQNGNGNDHH